MAFFTNKHVVVATGVVAPVLAVAAYYAVGWFVGEKAQPAEVGQSYRMAEMPNCRYESGGCGLKNQDFRLDFVIASRDSGRMALEMQSAFPLEGVMLALAEADADEPVPAPMTPLGDDGTTWSIEIDLPDPSRHRLFIVAAAQGSQYFGDVATAFTAEPE